MNNSPAKYRKLSEPFPNADAAFAALDAFRLELEALREKHKIPDIQFVVQWDYLLDDGEIGTSIISAGLGDQGKAESMLARALNQAQRDRQQLMDKIAASGLNRRGL